MPGFDDLHAAWKWIPIPRCDGRYRLAADDNRLPISTLIGYPAPVASHDIAAARDKVLVVRLRDGGVISYLRPDGTCLHTLNTAAGFERKLRQLGILWGAT